MPKVQYDFRTEQPESYEELELWIKHHYTSKEKSLIILGTPGIGKSETVELIIPEHARSPRMMGTNTPTRVFDYLNENKDRDIIVVDDARSVLRNPQGIELLMQITNSKPKNTVTYNTAASARGKSEKKAPSFETEARLIIINNGTKEFGDNIHALADRGHVLICEFSNEVIHARAGTFYLAPQGVTDAEELAIRKEIYDFIGNHLDQIPHLSLRSYGQALKIATNRAVNEKLDWKRFLRQVSQQTQRALDAKRLNDDLNLTVSERLAEYKRLHGASEQTYRRDLDSLNEKPKPGAIRNPFTNERQQPKQDGFVELELMKQETGLEELKARVKELEYLARLERDEVPDPGEEALAIDERFLAAAH